MKTMNPHLLMALNLKSSASTTPNLWHMLRVLNILEKSVVLAELEGHSMGR
jgi:hypothetical protein